MSERYSIFTTLVEPCTCGFTHHCATTGAGRAKVLVFGVWQGIVRHGRASLLALWAQKKKKISVFLNHARTITYKTT